MQNSSESSRQNTGARSLALGLGWFSIGLGLAELIAPRALSRLIGVRNRPLLLAFLGLRELASGIGILQQRRPAEWLWARVAGDVMDLSLLGAALAFDEAKTSKVEAAAAAVLGVAVLDLISARQNSETDPDSGSVHFRKTITINRSPEAVYSFWR